MIWVFVAVVWLGTAAATALVAQRHDRDRVVWFALGLVFPGAALAALLLGYPKAAARAGRLAPDVESALRDSRLAATLAREGPMTPAELAAAADLPPDVADKEMGALKILGLIRRAGGGTWRLDPRAADALGEGGDVDGPGDPRAGTE